MSTPVARKGVTTAESMTKTGPGTVWSGRDFYIDCASVIVDENPHRPAGASHAALRGTVRATAAAAGTTDGRLPTIGVEALEQLLHVTLLTVVCAWLAVGTHGLVAGGVGPTPSYRSPAGQRAVTAREATVESAAASSAPRL